QNPYKTPKLVSGNSRPPNADLWRNVHIAPQGHVNMYISTELEETKVLKDNFWGYFGAYDDSSTLSTVYSTSTVLYTTSSTWIALWYPTVRTQSRQVFRVSPFGLLQKLFVRSSTKANISKIYGNWKRDKHGFYHREREPRSSISAPRPSSYTSAMSLYDGDDHASHSFSALSGSGTTPLSPAPASAIALGELPSYRHYNNNSIHQAWEKPQAPLPFFLGSPMQTAHDPLRQLPPPQQKYQQYQQNQKQQQQQQFHLAGQGQDTMAMSELHLQQQLIHHEELVSLREQMRTHAKILDHLQKHEQRFKDTETLLKEFYLDMDLVDTRDRSGLDGQPKDSLHNGAPAQGTAAADTAATAASSAFGGGGSQGWIHRLFKRSDTKPKKGFSSVERQEEEEAATLRGNVFGIAGHEEAQNNNKGDHSGQSLPF
ncbi:hypothetical protein BGZ99_006634, partial [Dissophora globulifera]